MTTSSERPLATRWRRLRAAGRKALIPYLTAGFPDPATCRDMIRLAVASGADLLELGIPFSDPIADGPTIQRASARALAHGVSPAVVLEMLDDVRPEIPVVLFSYVNPILAYGTDRFLRDAAAAGAAALLVTDVPAGGDPAFEALVDQSALDRIRLIAPTTPPARVALALRGARGFVYVISRLGVTGARDRPGDGLRDTIGRVRAVTDLPIAVGFGVADAAQVRAIAPAADGVVVGSALLDALDGGKLAAAGTLLREFRTALDGSPAAPMPS